MMGVREDNVLNILNQLGINAVFEDGKYYISTLIENINIDLYCEIPPSFPYEFPNIYVSDDSYKNIRGISHIYTDKSICVFDKSKSIPNFYNPDAIIIDTIKETIETIRKGLRLENINDFFDEFNAYWETKAEFEFFSVVNFEEEFQKLKFAVFSDKSYIAKTPKDILELAQKNHEKIDNVSINDCIYIPLNGQLKKPIPSSQNEWLKIIKTSSKYYASYCKFLQGCKTKNSLIIYSQKINNSIVVSAFLHEHISQVSINGFRKGKVPLSLALTGKEGDKKVTPVIIKNISQQRLFFRGGMGINTNLPNVGIIGCGSLGGNLADGLAGCGVHQFTLIDNQVLNEDNIARHYCGFRFVGFSKSKALSIMLTEHNPNIICKTHHENAHILLENNINILQECDVIFITVGNAPLEYHVIQKILDEALNLSLVIMWVEPYAICGHAIVLNKSQDVFKELFDTDLSFTRSIVLNSDLHYKREAGCQSTFMPYSGLDVKMFVGFFIQKYFEILSVNKNKNYHFIWLGNISEAKKLNIEIDNKWVNKPNNSIIIERID